MLVSLTRLEPNPYRDFGLYPIDLTQLDTLKSSIEELGFWGGVTARPHPTKPDTYQIAAGHHRVRAARAAGIDAAEISVRDHDDDAMVQIMVKENMTQWGYNAAAAADSVAAVCRRILALVLPAKDPSEIPFDLVRPDAHLDKMQNRMRVDGPNRGLVVHYAPELRNAEVDNVLTSLIASGTMAHIIGQATGEVPDPIISYDVRCISVFRRLAHEKAFREVMTGENGRRFIPLAMQYQIALDVRRHLDSLAGNRLAGGAEVKRYLQETVIDKAARAQRQINKSEDAARVLQESMREKVQAQWKNVARGMNMSHSALHQLSKLYEDWDDSIPAPMDRAAKNQVRKTAERMLELLGTSRL